MSKKPSLFSKDRFNCGHYFGLLAFMFTSHLSTNFGFYVLSVVLFLMVMVLATISGDQYSNQ